MKGEYKDSWNVTHGRYYDRVYGRRGGGNA